MNIFTGIMVYVIVWWMTFFTVLPFGVKGQWEHKEGVTPGTEEAAPARPNLGRKALITTAIACIVWIIVYIAISQGLLDPRNPPFGPDLNARG